MVTGGRNADIAYAYNYQEWIVFDFARDQADRFPYAILECFKNGRIFSTKYESVIKYVDKTRVIVFTNFAPDKSKLSADRWDIHKLVRLQAQEQAPPAEAPRQEGVEIVQDPIEAQLRNL